MGIRNQTAPSDGGGCTVDRPSDGIPGGMLDLLLCGIGSSAVPLGITAERSDADLPAGTYPLTQVPSSAGLAPATTPDDPSRVIRLHLPVALPITAGPWTRPSSPSSRR